MGANELYLKPGTQVVMEMLIPLRMFKMRSANFQPNPATVRDAVLTKKLLQPKR